MTATHTPDQGLTPAVLGLRAAWLTRGIDMTPALIQELLELEQTPEVLAAIQALVELEAQP